MISLKPRLSLAGKLIAAFGTCALVTLMLAAGAIWSANHIGATIARLDSSEQQLRAFEQLAAILQQRHTAWTRFIYGGREDAMHNAEDAGAVARKLVDELIAIHSPAPGAAAAGLAGTGSSSDAGQLIRLQELRKMLDQMDAAWSASVIERGRQNVEQARRLFDEGCDQPLKRDLQPLIEAMMRVEQTEVEWQRSDVASTIASVREGAFDASIFAIGVAVIGLVLVWHSVEAVHKLREAEAAANETKTLFLANMSHEIRTPLNGILGFAQLLAQQTGDISNPETQDFIATIHSSGRHLLNLINDILDLSKVEVGQLDFEWGDHPVLPILEDVINVLRPRAEAKSIRLRFCWVGQVPRQIHTDPRRLKQVLLNLVGNAVKFTDQGEVAVEARVKQSGGLCQLVIDVVDTGIGIPLDQLERIFQPFCQADSSFTRVHEGTGLGLSISERLAKTLGGTIGVDSTVGEGTTFTLTLDLGPARRRGALRPAECRTVPGRSTAGRGPID